ncbi:glycosyltransferase family 4 protein [Patescibacteria group bacterium]|nr:glycosyltransferase family 4 protein [Patescibacteria group bacterium]
MRKELIIIYDTPSTTRDHLKRVHYLEYYLRFFNTIRILHWSKDKSLEILENKNDPFIFYPYARPYNSKYFSGIKYMFWIGRTLWRICQKSPVDTTLIFMPIMPIWPGLPALIVARFKRKKIVLRLEAHKLQYMKLEAELFHTPRVKIFIKLAIIKFVYYLSLRFYDAAIGISKDLTAAAKKYGVKQVLTIPIMINLAPFIAIDGGERRIFQPPVILYVGQIKNIKGIEYLIQAVHLLKKKDNIRIKLVIAGAVTNLKDESYFKDLRRSAVDLNVDWLGWISQEQIVKSYARAHIFVLPSLTEALGMATMEAMASGLPVIATQTSGSRDLVEEGKTGFLVSLEDAGALKEKLAILLGNPNLGIAMGQAGRLRIKKIREMTDENNKRLWSSLLK